MAGVFRMGERYQVPLYSELCGDVHRYGLDVTVLIFRMDARSDWMLWLVSKTGRPLIWDQVFHSEAEAYSEFEKFIREEAFSVLDKGYSDGSNVIPFRHR